MFILILQPRELKIVGVARPADSARRFWIPWTRNMWPGEKTLMATDGMN